MRTRWLPILLLAAAPVFGQLPSNTVTVTATRTLALQPDQVLLSLSVTAPPTGTLDQIAGALAGVGITATDLNGVGTNIDPVAFQWNFALEVPIANLTATLESLNQLEQSIGQNNSGLALTFIVAGMQVSQQLRQSQTCSNADLVSDAAAQAQKLAAAAGMTLGPIQELSNAPSTQPVFAEITGARLGAFVVGSLSAFAISPEPSPLICSLVAKFQLLP